MMRPDDNETYLDIKLLSNYLQIKVSTLYAWAAQKKIPSVKINGLIRFQKKEIDAWLETLRKEESKTPKIHFKDKRCDIDSLIAAAKKEVYNSSRGETRPKSAQGKEDLHGAV